MNTATKLAAYAAVVAVTFAGGAAVGAAVGPIDVGGQDHACMSDASSTLPQGLAVAAAGYRLVIDTSVVVLSRDLVGFHHLHPAMDASGHWTLDLPPLPPGSHRVFADFAPTGATKLTLGADIFVAGEAHTVAVPPPTANFAVDGYTVTLRGTPQVGDTELQFSVGRAGQAVTTDPYLGAAGHLVAIRTGDLAYLHVHPHDEAGPIITFTAPFLSAGSYRLFLDFAHDGVVRTGAFTVTVPDCGPESTPTHQGGH